MKDEQAGILETSGKTSRRWLDYAFAIVATSIATLLRLALAPVVGSGFPFLTYFVVVIILALYRGFWPAALSTLLSVIVGAYFILPPGGAENSFFGRSASVTIVGFIFLSLMVSFMIDFQGRTLVRARQAEKAQAAIAAENACLLRQARQSEEELLRANRELRRANRDLETFAYSAGHDLKEPLRTITISAELVERSLGPQSSGDRADFLRHIRTAVQRMEALLEGILAYSHVTREETGLPRADASDVLKDVLANLRGQLDQAGAVVTMGQLPMVPMHDSALAQIFQNLINNAVKFRGKEMPHVHIAAEERDDRYVFSVVDNGLGVESEYREQIFELFNRVHGPGEYPGSGMGLAICRRVVERFGGNIWLEQTDPGRGSTFCFFVPKERPRPSIEWAAR